MTQPEAQPEQHVVDPHTGVVYLMKTLPEFEGEHVSEAAIRFTSASNLPCTSPGGEVTLHYGDTIRVAVEARVVAVQHVENKDGELRRVAVCRAIDATFVPWNPADPTDDGIVRRHTAP